MKVLSIDTSNETCSVALLEDGRLINEFHSEDMKQHSVSLMPMIQKTLETSDLKLDNIDILGCGIGPGSFTGVRIAIATVKAFSDAKEIPIVGVNSLEAQAYNVIMQKGRDNCKIVSMIDAKNENAYVAVYRVHNKKISIYKNPEAMRISNITEYFNFQEPVYIVGDVDNQKLESLIQAKMAKEISQAKEIKEHEYITITKPLAQAIALATIDKYKNGLFGDSNSINPMYLQKPQAERQKDGDDNTYILEMTKNDLEEIKSNYNKFPNIWDYNTFKQDAGNSKYFVAKLNDEVVGFIGYKTIFDEIEIMNIVTREDKRNKGIASNLLSYVIRKIPSNKINLEVNEHNKVARNLYLKFGFDQTGIREKYYKDGSNAILMSL